MTESPPTDPSPPARETQPFTAVVPRPLALGDAARRESVGNLNRLLADTMALRDLYKKHHWQASGPHFYPLHLLFDKHAGEQADLIDAVAERVMTLGGVSVSAAADVAETTRVPRPPMGREAAAAQLARLLHAHEIVLREARTAARAAAAAGDDGTNDLLVSGVVRTNETQVWFLAEHLTDAAAAGAPPAPSPSLRGEPTMTPIGKLTTAAVLLAALAAAAPPRAAAAPPVSHKAVKVGGIDVFYREAGPPDAPAVLLLHGFPTSSQMFRNLIPALADKYRVVAPDYPGFGHSAMPGRETFKYTFDNLAAVIDGFTEQVGLTRYALYVQDYGAPVGYRLAVKHPERVSAIAVQNGNAYAEGLDNDFWKPIKAYWAEPASQAKREALRFVVSPEATRWQYTHGVPRPELVSPDGPAHDQYLLDRPGNADIQLDLMLDYGSNPPLYPAWQAYFRTHQPPVLIAWGKHDQIFPPAGAEPYKRDLKTLHFHLLDAGHFALETNGDEIGGLMRDFLGRHVTTGHVIKGAGR